MGVYHTKTGEVYVCDPNLENPIEVVIQHMLKAGFTVNEVSRILNVPEDEIYSICTQSL